MDKSMRELRSRYVLTPAGEAVVRAMRGNRPPPPCRCTDCTARRAAGRANA